MDSQPGSVHAETSLAALGTVHRVAMICTIRMAQHKNSCSYTNPQGLYEQRAKLLIFRNRASARALLREAPAFTQDASVEAMSV